MLTARDYFERCIAICRQHGFGRTAETLTTRARDLKDARRRAKEIGWLAALPSLDAALASARRQTS